MTEAIGKTTGQKRQDEYMRRTGNNGELDKHAFLELLVTQLRYQDPLNPKDNGEFLAQMAQFTALEQMQNLNAGVDRLHEAQTSYQDGLLERVDKLAEVVEELLFYQQISQHMLTGDDLLLLGKEVTIKTAEGDEVTGIVTAVTFGEKGGRLVVDGEEYKAVEILRVSTAPADKEEPENEEEVLPAEDGPAEMPAESAAAEEAAKEEHNSDTDSGEFDDRETEI